MDLGRQWAERLRHCDNAFREEYLLPVCTFHLDGFCTFEHLKLSDAQRQKLTSFAPGFSWGRKWEYAWVHASLNIPGELRGKRLWFTIGAGEEMLVFVNGREAGSIDKKHERIFLDEELTTGDPIELWAEVYAGHGPRLEDGGIVRRGTESVPEPPEHQCRVRESILGLIDGEVRQAYLDWSVLYELWQELPEGSVRGTEIGEALQKFSVTADFEAEQPRRRESILKAAAGLKPLTEVPNGPSVPEFSVIGQSHLDLAWLWTLQETHRKVARTYSNQLALMKRYPDFRFLMCEPILFDWMKEEYPELWERVKEKVKTGQMVPEGALYVEGDMNLPGGESIVRQFVYGKRWFAKELGANSRMAWMPDTFGYSGALPQIMKGARVDYFATQKLMRQDPECEPFPYHDFWWEGIDGTRVLSHSYKKNNARINPKEVLGRWNNDRMASQPGGEMLYPFGFGDGGGGVTEEMLEMQKRLKDLNGVPKCRMESPVDYFERLEKRGTRNVYYGELYLAWHRGTFTTQAKVKKGLRRAEEAVREAEYLAGLLRLEGHELSEERLGEIEHLWKNLLLNEFHDILPGTSIEQVAAEAREALETICCKARELAQTELRELAGEDAVFNSLSWNRKAGDVILPSAGYANVQTAAGETGPVPSASDISCEKTENGWQIRNAFYSATLSEQGELTSLRDLQSGFEYAAEPMNRFRLYQDINGCYDAWELARMYEDAEQTLRGGRIVSLETANGCIEAHLEQEEEYFTLHQTIRFAAESPRIEFDTKIDWRERHRILKVDFPTGIFTRELLTETQFGYQKRPTHRSTQHDRDRYEVAQHRYSALTDGENGLALLNDCKYGISAQDSRMSLTLLKAPVFPDGHADQGEHTFRYALYPFHGPLGRSRVLQEACEWNLLPTGTIPQGGSVRSEKSYFSLEGGSAVLDTCKPAFDEKDAVAIRLYEYAGSACRTVLHLPKKVRSVRTCNLLEEAVCELPIEDGHVDLCFGPFEIRTLLLTT